MKTSIEQWLTSHPKLKQWGWFILLWVSGLVSVMTLTYPIKWLFRFL